MSVTPYLLKEALRSQAEPSFHRPPDPGGSAEQLRRRSTRERPCFEVYTSTIDPEFLVSQGQLSDVAPVKHPYNFSMCVYGEGARRATPNELHSFAGSGVQVE